MELKGIALFLVVGGSILLAGLALAVSAGVLLQLARLEQMRWRLATSRAAFVRTLRRAVAGERIHDVGDMHHAYRAFFGIDALRASHLEEIADFLRAAMRPGASSPHRPAEARLPQTAHRLGKLLAANQRALEAERQWVPFAGTLEPERHLLEAVAELATAEGDGVDTKLAALATAIRIRQDTAQRLDRERSRLLRWAWWGWLGTAGFALLTIVFGVMALGG